MTDTLTELTDLHRTAIALVRAHVAGDTDTLFTLLAPVPQHQWPELLGTLVTLVIAARPDDLEPFLAHQLAAVNYAEAIAAEVADRPAECDDEPDPEPGR